MDVPKHVQVPEELQAGYDIGNDVDRVFCQLQITDPFGSHMTRIQVC